MKNFTILVFVCVTSLGMLCINGCIEKDKPEELEITSISEIFPESGHEESFSITSNVNWTVESSETWLTVTPSSGSKNGKVTVTAVANTTLLSRSATVTVSGVELTKTFFVTQKKGLEFLTLSTNSIKLPSSKAQGKFDVSTNISWTMYGKPYWLTTSSTRSPNSNDYTVTVKADDNTSASNRSVTLSIEGDGVPSQLLEVTQEGAAAYLDVSLLSMSFQPSSASKIFTISSNTNWTVESSETWLTISPSEGSNYKSITVKVDENTSPLPRNAKIIVSGSDITQTIDVTQEGLTFTVSTNSLSFPFTTEQKTFTINAITPNLSWTVQSSETWLAVSPTAGTNNGTITVTATENASTSQRNATITVTVGNATRTINVKQEALILSVSPNSLSFSASAAKKTLTISSNVSWTIESSDTWLTVTPSSGDNDGAVTIAANDNITSSSRSATLTLKGRGVTQTIKVTQAGPTASGDIMFWTSRNISKIDVTLAGQPTRTITMYYPNGTPDCGAVGTATFTYLSPGTYKFTITHSLGSSTRTVNRTESCHKISIF